MKENIGKYARDKITGFEGTITVFASHITGCDTYSLQPKCKTGSNEIPDSRGFDIGRIEIINTEIPITPEQVSDPSGKKGACDIGRMA
jgi:hypothetical protein